MSYNYVRMHYVSMLYTCASSLHQTPVIDTMSVGHHVATVGTAIRVPIWLSEEDRELKKDALLHRALKLPEGEIIFREAVTESLSLHCPQPHTKPTSSTTTNAATADVTASGTAGATAADATTGTGSGTSVAGATSGSSTDMAVDTTASTTTSNSGNSGSKGGATAVAVASKLSSMAVDDTTATTTADTTVTNTTTASNNNEGNQGTSDSPATVDAPAETQWLSTVPIKEAPQLLLVPGHDCEPETFPAGLLFGAAHALPTCFVLERVLLASALRRAADLPCVVADTEAALRRPANERLETLGDAWLKLYMSLVVMQAQQQQRVNLKCCCANDSTYGHTVAETHT
eukprot:11610-Heterococcus_DN1.PRE.2